MEEPAALQNLWEQTRATGGQQKGAIALGAANLLGIGILAGWQGGLAALANSNLAFMLNLLPFLGVRTSFFDVMLSDLTALHARQVLCATSEHGFQPCTICRQV